MPYGINRSMPSMIYSSYFCFKNNNMLKILGLSNDKNSATQPPRNFRSHPLPSRPLFREFRVQTKSIAQPSNNPNPHARSRSINPLENHRQTLLHQGTILFYLTAHRQQRMLVFSVRLRGGLNSPKDTWREWRRAKRGRGGWRAILTDDPGRDRSHAN